jgi:hypothetical protein
MNIPSNPDSSFYLSHPEIKGLQPGDEFTIKARVKTVHSTDSVESKNEHCSIDSEIISINGNNVSKKENKPKKSRDDEFDEEMDKAIDEEKPKKKDDEDEY